MWPNSPAVWPGTDGLYPKTVPLESHSLDADALAKTAFSKGTWISDPKHLEYPSLGFLEELFLP